MHWKSHRNPESGIYVQNPRQGSSSSDILVLVPEFAGVSCEATDKAETILFLSSDFRSATPKEINIVHIVKIR